MKNFTAVDDISDVFPMILDGFGTRCLVMSLDRANGQYLSELNRFAKSRKPTGQASWWNPKKGMESRRNSMRKGA